MWGRMWWLLMECRAASIEKVKKGEEEEAKSACEIEMKKVRKTVNYE